MSTLTQILAAALKRSDLAGKRLLVAVSGGADSVALLRGLQAVHAGQLIAAHLNHGLREAADEDAAWVGRLCQSLDVPLVLEKADVSAEPRGASLEAEARRIRYAFLEGAAREGDCAAIAVAHTAADQVETVLHHILRGTGLSGLRGMTRERRLPGGILLVRPLLAATRETVEAFLAQIGQDYRFDATNRDPRFTRNRIRHELLPRLREDFNPQVDDALLRLAAQAAGVEDTVAWAAEQALHACLLDRSPEVCRLATAELAQLPRHLIRECLVQLWRGQDWPLQSMGFADWERLADLADGAGAINLPGGVSALRRGGLLVLSRQSGK